GHHLGAVLARPRARSAPRNRRRVRRLFVCGQTMGPRGPTLADRGRRACAQRQARLQVAHCGVTAMPRNCVFSADVASVVKAGFAEPSSTSITTLLTPAATVV